MFRRTLLLLALCITFATAKTAPTQELAHPGWRGNNIAPEAWYRHTTLVRFPAGATFAQATTGMDALSTVGADSLILPDLDPPAGATRPYADTFGTEEQLDTLLREASARRMHVLLQAPLARLTAHPDETRFWMNHGIAGFDVGAITAADTASLQTLRTTLDHFPGQRILLAHQQGDIALDRRATSRMPLAFRIVSEAAPASSTPQFVEVAATTAANSKDPANDLLRSFLPLLLASGRPIFDSRIIATAEGRAALQQMLQLRNSRPTLRSGQSIPLQSGDIKAWLIKGNSRPGERSLVIVENAGAAPATLHLQQLLRTANARGTFLRPILRTDGGMGALDLEGSILPPGTFAIAELQ